MKRFAFLCVLLAGCQSTAAVVPEPPHQSLPPIVLGAKPSTKPQLMTLRLTLSNPEDLKVREGDAVAKGQVLSDRASARQRLEQQKQALQLKLNALSAPPKPFPVDTQVEQAQVVKATQKVRQMKAAIAQFQQASPWTEYAWSALPLDKDTSRLSVLQNNLENAQAELAVAIAKLKNAQQPVLPETNAHELQQSLLLQQVHDTDVQLSNLGVVKSSYTGMVQKVKWLGQTNQNLSVELAIAVSQAKPKVGTNRLMPK